ncbi:MAG: hypothetical protein AAFU67_10315, partial [Bacteroidota bacterium]
YKQVNGRPVKQEVISSWTNENEVVIAEGLTADDVIYLTTPDGAENMEIVPLAAGERTEAEKALLSERAERKKIADEKEAKLPDEKPIQSGGGGDGFVIYF